MFLSLSVSVCCVFVVLSNQKGRKSCSDAHFIEILFPPIDGIIKSCCEFKANRELRERERESENEKEARKGQMCGAW